MRRRGFAMGMVLFAMILVSSVVTVVFIAFASDVRRTQTATTGPQLRRLLIAGNVAAQAQLNAQPQPVPDTEIPTPIPEAHLTLHLATPATDSTATFLIEARLRTQRASQTITFTRNNGTWTLTSVHLNAMPG